MLQVQQLIGFGVLPFGPVFIAAASAGPSGGPNITISVPSGTANGDLMIAVVCLAARSTGAGDFNTPAGWTSRLTFINDNVNPGVGIFTRVASSEPANYTFTATDGEVSNLSGSIVTYRGGQYEGISTMATGTSTAPATNTLATSYGSVLSCSIFTFNYGGSNDFTSTAPATERANILTSPNHAVQDAGGFLGTIPAQAGTLANSCYWRAWQISVRPS